MKPKRVVDVGALMKKLGGLDLQEGRPPLVLSASKEVAIRRDLGVRGYHLLTIRRITAIVVRDRKGRLVDHLSGRALAFRPRARDGGRDCHSDDEGAFTKPLPCRRLLTVDV